MNSLDDRTRIDRSAPPICRPHAHAPAPHDSRSAAPCSAALRSNSFSTARGRRGRRFGRGGGGGFPRIAPRALHCRPAVQRLQRRLLHMRALPPPALPPCGPTPSVPPRRRGPKDPRWTIARARIRVPLPPPPPPKTTTGSRAFRSTRGRRARRLRGGGEGSPRIAPRARASAGPTPAAADAESGSRGRRGLSGAPSHSPGWCAPAPAQR